MHPGVMHRSICRYYEVMQDCCPDNQQAVLCMHSVSFPFSLYVGSQSDVTSLEEGSSTAQPDAMRVSIPVCLSVCVCVCVVCVWGGGPVHTEN